jgi:hypothetical protein
LDAKGLTRAANAAYRVTLGGLAGVALLTVIPMVTDDHGSEVNERYRQTASHVMALTSAADRIMLSHPQVAYFAQRHHFVSVFEPDVSQLLRVLDDPEERVVLIVTDPRLHTLHPSMTDAERAAFWSYVTAHFERVPAADASTYWQRTSW